MDDFRDIREQGNISQQPSWMDVLMALKANIMRNLKVAELAIVKSINEDEISCVLLNDPEKTFKAHNPFNTEVSVDSVVLVIFLDIYSKSNIERYKRTGNINELIRVDHKNLHALDYGIILPATGGSGAVSSVNGKTGDVVLTAEDVGALPADTPIPVVNVKRYNGIISQNDWEHVGNRYMYTLPQSVHQLSNPMLLDYLVQGNTGYSHGMCNYEVLTNGNILFTSDLDANVKYVILGE